MNSNVVMIAVSHSYLVLAPRSIFPSDRNNFYNEFDPVLVLLLDLGIVNKSLLLLFTFS